MSGIDKFIVNSIRWVSLELRTMGLLGNYGKVRLCVCARARTFLAVRKKKSLIEPSNTLSE